MDKANSQSTSTKTSSPNVSFGDLVSQLLAVKIKVDKHLEDFKEDVEKIEAYYAPRAEFDRWRATEAGKEWKAKKFKLQSACCANAKCQKEINLKGSHIDHIKPIAKFPHLNLDTKNLRILCPDCNVRKGDRVS